MWFSCYHTLLAGGHANHLLDRLVGESRHQGEHSLDAQERHALIAVSQGEGALDAVKQGEGALLRWGEVAAQGGARRIDVRLRGDEIQAEVKHGGCCLAVTAVVRDGVAVAIRLSVTVTGGRGNAVEQPAADL